MRTSESEYLASVGTDYNNDRAIDLVVDGKTTVTSSRIHAKEVPRHATMVLCHACWSQSAVAVLDFNHDGWMDLAFTYEARRA